MPNRPYLGRMVDDTIAMFKPHVSGTEGAVSANNPYAAEAGLEILKSGGNAFDAACAISLVLGVVEPYHSGIGGGCFHVFYDKKSDSFHSVDARGVAPKNAYQDMFLDENGDVDLNLTEFSGRSVAVPALYRAMDNLLKQYGSLEDGEAAKEEDFIIVDFEQGETRIEGTYVALRNVSEAVRPSFVGLKAGDTLDVNVNEAFTNEADRASMLKVSKEELAGIDPLYKMTVKNVKTFVSAPLNQDTFDKIFGEGNVKSEEEFDAKIAERLAAEYGQESEFRFSKDAKAYLVKKAAISLPEKFLKRWIYVANDGKFTMEDIEKEFDLFLEDYRWQMVRNYLMDKYSVKIEEADLMASAKAFAAYQFAMYGINNVPDDQLESYAKTILSQEKEGRRVLEQVEDTKTLSAVKNVVSLEDTKVSVEKFRELA